MPVRSNVQIREYQKVQLSEKELNNWQVAELTKGSGLC